MATTAPSWVPDFAKARRRALVERVGTIGAQRVYSARCSEDLVDSSHWKDGDAQLVDRLELFVCHRWIEDGDADSAWRRVGSICDAARFDCMVRQVALAEALVLSWRTDGIVLSHLEQQDHFLAGVVSVLREELGAAEITVFAAIVRAMLGARMDRRRLRRMAANPTVPTRWRSLRWAGLVNEAPYDPDMVV